MLPHLDSSYHVSDFKHLSSKAIQGFNVSTYFGSLPDSGEASTHTTDLETLNAHWNAQQYCNFKRALIQSANSKENLHFQCHALSEKKFRHWNQTGFFRHLVSVSSVHDLLRFSQIILCVYFFLTKTNLAKAYRDFVISFRNNLYRLSSRNHGW